MEIWLDTTDFKTIEHAHALEILHGITTNPSLLAKAGQLPHHLFQELLNTQEGPIAVQIHETTKQDMLIQAHALYKFSSRFIIKVPACREGYFVIQQLVEECIPVMATAIFEPTQAFLSLKLGAAYIAPYLGRMEDEQLNPSIFLKLVEKMKATYGFDGKVIAAGIRSLDHIALAIEYGVAAITLPKAIYEDFISAPIGTEKALTEFKQAKTLIESIKAR